MCYVMNIIIWAEGIQPLYGTNELLKIVYDVRVATLAMYSYAGLTRGLLSRLK